MLFVVVAIELTDNFYAPVKQPISAATIVKWNGVQTLGRMNWT